MAITTAVHTPSPRTGRYRAQQHGLLPLTQQAMRFYGRIGVYDSASRDRAGDVQPL